MSFVKISHGKWRNETINNHIFPVIQNFKEGKKGPFITVDGSHAFGEEHKKIRIRVQPDNVVWVSRHDYEYHCAMLADTKNDPKVETESVDDETRMAQIEERFEVLENMTDALIQGDIRALIVTGPPGVGKSFGVERQLYRCETFDALAGRTRYEVIKGAMTPLGLYAKLHKFRNEGDVVVFDDCDCVLFDDLSLNILKAALDSGKRRRIYWNAESRKLRDEGIPNDFEFKGSACFITNVDFHNVRSKKIRDHLEALMSRCHYVDLTMNTMRDKLLRIKQITSSGKLFGKELETSEQAEVMNFIEENKDRFHEMSLRTALKVGDIRRMYRVSDNPDQWKRVAEITCMKRGK